MTIVLGYLTIAGIFGYWPFPQPPNVQIDLASSRFNPQDDGGAASEYVCLVNEDGDAVELTGWVLRDAEGDVNVLPQFTLEAGAAVRIHPGPGRNSQSDLFGEGDSAEWNNDGDSVTLLSADGETIDSRSYGVREEGGGGGCGP